MPDTVQSPNALARMALAAAPKVGHLIVSALGCLGLAFYFGDTRATLAFLAFGVILLCLAALIGGLVHRYRRGQRHFWRAVAALVEHDAVPTFVAAGAGKVLFRNAAAIKAFPEARSDTLAAAFDNLFAAPATVLHRLRTCADLDGAASEDITASHGTLRLSAHRVDPGSYVWRVDTLVARVYDPPDDTRANPKSALPMLRANKAGAIVDMNAAMLEFPGDRPATLDRVVTDLPLHSGRGHLVETALGRVETHLAVIKDDDGLQQVHVLPENTPDRNWAQIDAIPVPLMKISIDGQILMANRRAQKLLSLPGAASLDFADVVEGMGRPVDEWLLDVSEGRNANRTEVVRATRPAQDVFLQVALGRMVEGSNVALLAVLIDATELKTLEAQFVQSQKMQAIGQLAGGVAHDFNNLLTAIGGHCDLLLLRNEPGDRDYSDLVQINRNANRAASLVGQLLAFSRKQNMQIELIDLRDTVGDLTHLLNRLVGEKIHLDWAHDPDLPQIRADKRQLEQVLMNLVVNARDAMPCGGRIKVETRAIQLAEPLMRDRAIVPPGEFVMVTVEDEGCGIAADKLPRIFEPFFSTKRLGEGTGLGLSMAYGIVKQSGGFIFADSTISQGTCFTLYFPAHRGSPVLPVAGPSATPGLQVRSKGGVVLLVEDEAPVRAFASRALRLCGYTVLEAGCAEEALQMLEDAELDVDVFVTDVVMPGMDGPGWVSRALRQRPDVRVVFVSGYAEDSFSHNRAKIPNSVFLPKPFSLSQLTQTVQGQFHQDRIVGLGTGQKAGPISGSRSK